jgi:iron-sulfur cluster repair protein YtfE (RIC family)
MINILSLLIQEHVAMLAHLERIAADPGTSPDSRGRHIADLTALLRDHMHFEEKTLYPLLMLHVDASAMGARASAQHREIDAQIAKFARAAASDAPWPAQLGALALALRRHFAEEEAMILPRLRRMMTDGMLRELATRYQAARTPNVELTTLAR